MYQTKRVDACRPPQRSEGGARHDTYRTGMRVRAADGDFSTICAKPGRRIITRRIVAGWIVTGGIVTGRFHTRSRGADHGRKLRRKYYTGRTAVELGLTDRHDDIDRLYPVRLRRGRHHRC